MTSIEAGLGAVVVLGVLAAAAILRKARNAGLALQAQIAALGEHVDWVRSDHNLWAERLQKDLADVRQETQSAASEAAQALQTMTALVNALAAKADETAATMDLLARKPIHTLRIDTLPNEDASGDVQLRRLAASLAILRPLVPYPRWYTDAELFNPDLSYQLRRWFWQYFHDRKRDAAIEVPWHGGTRLRLYLGNDVSGQIYIAGCWEPNELAFIDRVLEPGMTFLDAGANDGVYTVFAAKRVGPTGTVWAFEPSRRELERLEYNLKLNQLSARVFPFALAESKGQAELMVGGYEHEGHNTLGAFAYAGVEMAGKQTVELRRLDDIVAETEPARIDLIKLDVEGAEMRVLGGAVETLRRYQPLVLFELSEQSLRNQGSSSEELMAFVQAQKYQLYAFDNGTGLVVPAGSGMVSSNMVGVPEGKTLPETVRQLWPYTC